MLLNSIAWILYVTQKTENNKMLLTTMTYLLILKGLSAIKMNKYYAAQTLTNVKYITKFHAKIPIIIVTGAKTWRGWENMSSFNITFNFFTGLTC